MNSDDVRNPFAPPAAAGALEQQELVLYTPRQIGMGAFFGGVPAGAFMCLANHRTEGELRRGWFVVLISGVVLTLILVASGSSSIYGVLTAAGFFHYAKMCEVRRRREASVAVPTRFRSNWLVVAVALGSLVALIFVGILLEYGPTSRGMSELVYDLGLSSELPLDP